MLRYHEEDSSEYQPNIESLQKKASIKQASRIEFMGELLRSKGFVWLATSHYFIGGWQHAGNVLRFCHFDNMKMKHNIHSIQFFRLEAEGPWMVENPEMWEGTPEEELVRKEMTKENGEEYAYGDRRQELVFIGMNLNHEKIQNILDHCLLSDVEMEMKPMGWFEKWDDINKIK